MNCQDLVEKFVKNRDESAVNEIVKMMIDKSLTLLDLIITVGDSLQSVELSKRSTSLTLISRVLGSLPNTFLQANEIHHLLVFVTGKLSDHHILAQPTVDLFHILSKQVAITDDDCLMMLRSIFADVYVQSFPQDSRHKVFFIFLHLLLDRLDVVEQMGSDFVCNFIQAMDGERDPRNLVLCFQCLQYMVKYLDIEPYKEELFEVVACYFPMEYKPKTNSNENEEAITHEQLSISLRNVLTSTDKFAPFCLPMLLEKLDSEIPSARLAAMDVFIHSIDEYDARSVKTFLVPLWNLLSKQALCAENQEIETTAHRAITALMQLIGKSVQNDQTEISTKKFVDRAIRECENFLKELNMKLAWPATKVLQAVARANSTCASSIWSSILPLLMKQFENLEQNVHKRTVLDMIIYFLQPTGIRTIVKLPSNVSEELWLLVASHFDEFPSHCLSLVHCLLQLNTVPAQLLEDHLTKLILQNNYSDDIKFKLSTVLKSLASSVLCDRSVNNLLTNLINSWTTTKSSPANEILSCCIDLCQNSERCQERLERFFNRNQNFVRLLPSLFKYLPSTYVLNELFDPLADILSETIATDPDAKTFCARCGSIADENCREFIENHFQKFLVEFPSTQTKNLLPMIYFIGNLKRKIFLGELQSMNDRISQDLVERIFDQTTRESTEIFAFFYANLLNKLSSNESTIERVELIFKRCEQSLNERNLQIWTIVVKGLIFARPSLSNQYVEQIIGWMKEPSSISDLASHSLARLTQFDEEMLLLSSHADCSVHPMIQQILFTTIFKQIKPLLLGNELSTAQMNVFVDLLGKVPKSLVKDEIVSLLPILIRALISPEESVWSSALNPICDLAQSQPNAIVDHLETVIPRLMSLALYPHSMNARITSLKSLKYLTNLPIHKIQPFRRSIIHVLKKCVDDRKRLVRKQAVETQMSWCLLNA